MEYTKRKKAIINFLYVVIILFLVYIFINFGLVLLSPFLIAFIVAYFIRIPTRFLSSRLKIPYKPVSIVLVFLFYSIVGILISQLGIKLFNSVINLVSNLPHIYKTHIESSLISIYNGIEQVVYRMDPALISQLEKYFNQFSQSIGQLVSIISTKAVGAVSSYASSLPGMFIKILIMIISTFFIVMDYDNMADFIMRQFSDKGRELFTHIREYIVGTLFVCIRAYALIMTITFAELSIGLTVLGVSNPVLIAFLIAIFDVLPVLGTGGIMIPWAIITALRGNLTLAIGLLVVYLTITVVRNIIEPKIVGAQIGLHPVVTLMSMYVGVYFFGVIGLFGFPITLSLLRHLNDTGTIKLFK